MGVGVLTIPALMMKIGMIGGIICLFIGACLCYFSFTSIFEASIFLGIKEFSEAVNTLLPSFIAKTFKYTYILDLGCFGVIYSIFGYNLFEFLLFSMGLMKDDWINPDKPMEFNEYQPGLILLRLVYFVVLFILIAPFLLKKELESLKPISLIFLCTVMFLLLDLLVEAPYFRSFYLSPENKGKKLTFEFFKSFGLDWIPIFYSLTLSYYVQPLVLTLRQEILSPSKVRLRKIAFLSVMTEFVIYIFFASVCYACFGDNYIPKLIIIRNPYDGKSVWSETITKVAIFLFFLLTNLGLPVFNPGLRSYLSKYIKIGGERKTHVFLSLVPFTIIFIIAFSIPFILDLFWFIGLIFCNFNGFIIPAMMKLAVLKR